jgi:acid stress chaperone HdeB
MKTKLFLAVAMFAFTVPASAQVVVDMSQITCGQFISSKDIDQPVIASWIGGYFSSSRNLTMIDSRYVKRNLDVITKYCKENKSAPLLESAMKEFH